jgi:hypothetical protein
MQQFDGTSESIAGMLFSVDCSLLATKPAIWRQNECGSTANRIALEMHRFGAE